MNIEKVDWSFDNQEIMKFHREGESVEREIIVNVLCKFVKDRDIPLNEELAYFIDDVELEVLNHTWWLRQLLIEYRFPFAIYDLKNFILRNLRVIDLGIGGPAFIFDVRR